MNKIAVFIPIHNEEVYIERTISSVLAQDHVDFDIFISENHSTDGTLIKLRELERKDSRIKLLRPTEKLNSYGNFCFLVDKVDQGNYFASMMIGGHDMLSHNVLSSALKHLEDNPSCAVAYQRSSFEIDEKDTITRKWPVCHESGHMNTAFDAVLTLITLMYNTPIFGLWRQSVRKQVQYRYPCVGGDHLYVAEAAIHGSITPIDEAQMFLRRAPPSANYLEKHFTNAQGDEAAARDMYVQLSWLSNILDEATRGQPKIARELMRASAFSLYLLRYNHHFATFQSTFNAFAAQSGVNSILQEQISLGERFQQLLESKDNSNHASL